MKNNGFRFMFMNKVNEDVAKFKQSLNAVQKYNYSNGDRYNFTRLHDVAIHIADVIGCGLDEWLSSKETKGNTRCNWTIDAHKLASEYFTDAYEGELTDADKKEIETTVSLVLVEEIKEDVMRVLREIVIYECSEIVDIGVGDHRDMITLDGYKMIIDTGILTKDTVVKNIIEKNNSINSYTIKKNQLDILDKLKVYTRIADKCYDAFEDEIDIYFDKIVKDRVYASNFKLPVENSDIDVKTLVQIVKYTFVNYLTQKYGVPLSSISVSESGVLTITGLDVIGYNIRNIIDDLV